MQRLFQEQLDRPCPCNSDHLYGACCFPIHYRAFMASMAAGIAIYTAQFFGWLTFLPAIPVAIVTAWGTVQYLRRRTLHAQVAERVKNHMNSVSAECAVIDCSYCGRANEINAARCTECGTQLPSKEEHMKRRIQQAIADEYRREIRTVRETKAARPMSLLTRIMYLLAITVPLLLLKYLPLLISQ